MVVRHRKGLDAGIGQSIHGAPGRDERKRVGVRWRRHQVRYGAFEVGDSPVRAHELIAHLAEGIEVVVVLHHLLIDPAPQDNIGSHDHIERGNRRGQRRCQRCRETTHVQPACHQFVRRTDAQGQWCEGSLRHIAASLCWIDAVNAEVVLVNHFEDGAGCDITRH